MSLLEMLLLASRGGSRSEFGLTRRKQEESSCDSGACRPPSFAGSTCSASIGNTRPLAHSFGEPVGLTLIFLRRGPDAANSRPSIVVRQKIPGPTVSAL